MRRSGQGGGRQTESACDYVAVNALALLIAAVLGLCSELGVAKVAAEEPEIRWWKGNIHTHSLWSDGNDFPEMIGEWYRSRDYNFLALTDHNILSDGIRWFSHDEIVKRGGADALQKYRDQFGQSWVETRGEEGTNTFEVRLKPLNEFRALLEERGKFIMIPGEEISDKAEGVPVHMNATNIKELIRPVGGDTVSVAIENNFRAVQEQAEREGREILVHLNHPNFGYAITAEAIADVVSEKFFEVYNGHPGVNQLGDDDHPDLELFWDIANTIRIAKWKAAPLFGLATDDSHYYHGKKGARPGRGWIMVQSRYLTPEHLIRNIYAGNFYASSGVELNSVDFDSNTMRLSMDIVADDDAQFTTQFIGTPVKYDSTSEARVDDQGKPIRATRKYSADVGKVLATVEGRQPSYRLTGEELYVRAVITSTRPHPEPSYNGQFEQAWTQPVGWDISRER